MHNSLITCAFTQGEESKLYQHFILNKNKISLIKQPTSAQG